MILVAIFIQLFSLPATFFLSSLLFMLFLNKSNLNPAALIIFSRVFNGVSLGLVQGIFIKLDFYGFLYPYMVVLYTIFFVEKNQVALLRLGIQRWWSLAVCLISFAASSFVIVALLR